MSMCRVFSCVVGRGCLLWPVHSLGKTLLTFYLFPFCTTRPHLPVTPGVSWLPTFAFQFPTIKGHFFVCVSSRRSCRWYPFHHRGPRCKSRKSRDAWSNRQISPWSTKWSRSKVRVLPRECTGHSKHPLPTTQRRLYTWTWPDGQYRNQIDYILCRQRWKSSIQSATTRPGGDCVSDHEFLIAKFRPKLKKVGKTTRPFRYDLNQIPYDYIVEVTNRFKGLDLIDRVPEELWTEVRDIVQKAVIFKMDYKVPCP